MTSRCQTTPHRGLGPRYGKHLSHLARAFPTPSRRDDAVMVRSRTATWLDFDFSTFEMYGLRSCTYQYMNSPTPRRFATDYVPGINWYRGQPSYVWDRLCSVCAASLHACFSVFNPFSVYVVRFLLEISRTDCSAVDEYFRAQSILFIFGMGQRISDQTCSAPLGCLSVYMRPTAERSNRQQYVTSPGSTGSYHARTT